MFTLALLHAARRNNVLAILISKRKTCSVTGIIGVIKNVLLNLIEKHHGDYFACFRGATVLSSAILCEVGTHLLKPLFHVLRLVLFVLFPGLEVRPICPFLTLNISKKCRKLVFNA